MPRFVIHQHFTKEAHFDLRLEKNGALIAWSFQQEPSDGWHAKNFGAQIEEQPSSLLDFEGEISESAHGAGNAKIWDKGECTVMKTTADFVKCEIKGVKIKGIFKLVKTRPNENRWLMMKTRSQRPSAPHQKKEHPQVHRPAEINREDAKKLLFCAERNDSLIFTLFMLISEGVSEHEAFSLTGSNFHFGESPVYLMAGSRKIVLKDNLAFKIWQVFKDNNITPDRKLFAPHAFIMKRLQKVCETAKVRFGKNILEMFRKNR